jgi:hypothetical protein
MFVILLGALALGAGADAPKPSPRIVTASVKDDWLVCKTTQNVAIPVITTQKVNNNGKEEDVTTYSTRIEMRTLEQAFELKKASFSTAGGKKLDLDAAKKRLEKPQPVVLSGDGKAVDESYLKLFDKDALVIVVPPPVPQAPKAIPPLPGGPPKAVAAPKKG